MSKTHVPVYGNRVLAGLSNTNVNISHEHRQVNSRNVLNLQEKGSIIQTKYQESVGKSWLGCPYENSSLKAAKAYRNWGHCHPDDDHDVWKCTSLLMSAHTHIPHTTTASSYHCTMPTVNLTLSWSDFSTHFTMHQKNHFIKSPTRYTVQLKGNFKHAGWAHAFQVISTRIRVCVYG